MPVEIRGVDRGLRAIINPHQEGDQKSRRKPRDRMAGELPPDKKGEKLGQGSSRGHGTGGKIDQWRIRNHAIDSALPFERGILL